MAVHVRDHIVYGMNKRKLEKTEWAIMNGQPRDTGNIGHTIYLSKNLYIL